MQIQIQRLPDVTQYLTNYLQIPITADSTLLFVFKTLYRSDDVLVDIYLNEITEDSLIIGGRKLAPDSIVSYPRYDLGFNWYISCVDQDGVDLPLTQYNMYKFYLQFTLDDDEDFGDTEEV